MESSLGTSVSQPGPGALGSPGVQGLERPRPELQCGADPVSSQREPPGDSWWEGSASCCPGKCRDKGRGRTGLGRGAPQLQWRQPCPSQAPARVPSCCLAFCGQLCCSGRSQPGALDPEASRHRGRCRWAVSQVLNGTLTLPLAGRDLLGQAAQMTGEGETGSLIGRGGGRQASSRR